MEKINKLIANIEDEIKRNEESMKKGLLGNVNPKILEIYNNNITYLETFKDMALKVKEE